MITLFLFYNKFQFHSFHVQDWHQSILIADSSLLFISRFSFSTFETIIFSFFFNFSLESRSLCLRHYCLVYFFCCHFCTLNYSKRWHANKNANSSICCKNNLKENRTSQLKNFLLTKRSCINNFKKTKFTLKRVNAATYYIFYGTCTNRIKGGQKLAINLLSLLYFCQHVSRYALSGLCL